MSHSCTKFSILVRSLVNGVGQLMLYSFHGVGFMVVTSVVAVNGFVAVDAISVSRVLPLDFIWFKLVIVR